MDENQGDQNSKIRYKHIPRTDTREFLAPDSDDNEELGFENMRIFGLDPIGGQPLGKLSESSSSKKYEIARRERELTDARRHLSRLSTSPVRISMLRKFLGVDQDAEVSAESFSQEKMADDDLIALIEKHVASIEQVMIDFNKRIPDFIKRFDNFVIDNENSIDPDSIKIFNIDPLSVAAFKELLPIIGSRFNKERGRLNIVPADPMTIIPGPLSDVGGRYHPSTNTIFLFITPEESVPYTFAFTHELLHGLSGITSLGHVAENEYNEEVIHDIDLQRVGLRFDHPDELYRTKNHAEKERMPRFHWLNEAVTDELTSLFFSGFPLSYINERKILGDLALAMRDRNPDQNPYLLFYNAYLEDYNSSAPLGKRVPHWHTLQRAITDTFGQGFLVELDRYILEHGVVKGRQFLNEKILAMKEKGE
ncbi:hypothetical protein A3D80_01035 [Candidatus Roizmanbacteria bacterium RIFCSPHIGHO2_02_FULL_40_13b]|uniref:Uncharacterized protein n=1 Tax=Candidatus Roizmanbacteria bacterium RIFCSPHIGHO2_01_FULL_39_24 TaxID=1802032 RepID=A0A1F7GMQ9_9BACT|nr:MAG: hypothetical protein A2799_02690 [Candidatus Roizmanbacteria bacterium RIFCSPHIGHO2_01_FULL_39_24]OGK26280.1 MAG: hypothetical protein A3D80_01035 [Candidatus Roizmanbacteria bacterium RIFCSPHIGHO2_02_FULL_40_13b]OGK49343.1 MAG: hypothetical protein A3A56_03665 [Candidatus Roizmanbacteria bacterium RIFCSPLOWO2_01_FULL_40_32]